MNHTDSYKSSRAVMDGYDVRNTVFLQLLLIFRIPIVADVKAGQNLRVIDEREKTNSEKLAPKSKLQKQQKRHSKIGQ